MPPDTTSGTIFWALTGFLIGLCLGSFLLTAAIRWQADRGSILTGRSACPSCGAPLQARDLIPLLSWLMTKGHCRHCRATIPRLYPMAELVAGGIGGVSMALVALPGGLVVALLGWWLLLASLIDLRTMELPDSLTLVLVLIGLAMAWFDVWPFLGLAGLHQLDALLGAIAGYAIFWIINRTYRSFRGREGLGLGDAKLLAAGGALCGGQWLPEIALVAALATLTAAMATGQLDDRFRALPFGPGLAFAIWAVFLIRQTL